MAKICEECGHNNDADNFTCLNCGGEQFKISDPERSADPNPPQSIKHMADRPDGSVPNLMAALLLVLALLLFMFASNYEIDSRYISGGAYSSGTFLQDQDDLAAQYLMYLGAALCVHLSVICFAMGAIIKAIWFVHGVESKEQK